MHRLPLEWQVVDLLKVFSTFAGFLELLLVLRAAADLPPAHEVLANNGPLGLRALYFRIRQMDFRIRQVERSTLRGPKIGRIFGVVSVRCTRRQSCTARHLVEDNSG